MNLPGILIVIILGALGYAVYSDVSSPPNSYAPVDITNKYNLPESMKDCTVTEIDGRNVVSIPVIRCPNSMTAIKYRVGKLTQTVVTIDGNTYAVDEDK